MSGKDDWYVYVISTDDGHYKIGMSRDPRDRWATLLAGIPEPSRINLMIKCIDKSHARDLEKEILDALSEFNTVGEWFRAPKAVVAELVLDLGIRTKSMERQPPEIAFHDEPNFKLFEKYSVKAQ